jgi:hypothetical protein
MRRRYVVAAVAALVVQVVTTAVVVTNLDRPDPEPPLPGRLVSAEPLVFRYDLTVRPTIGVRILADAESYRDVSALADGLVGSSNTGHILFHRNIGCDAVSGPQLRRDATGYLLAFTTVKHRPECAAPNAALVVFTHP